MYDDDSFNIATVPRHAVFGAQAGSGDDESTLGDRFFDLLLSQTNTVTKIDSDHCMSLRHRRKPSPSNIEQQFERNTIAEVTNTTGITDTAKVSSVDTINVPCENIHDNVPFELNRLAMFRPPSRTRLSGCRSNTVLREDSAENTVQASSCTVELSHGENSGPNGYVKRKSANCTSKIFSNGSNQPAKTLRSSTSRPSYPTQIYQRLLNRNRSHVQSAETKRKIGPATCQPTTKVRAASAEPRTQKATINLLRSDSSLIKKTTEMGVRIKPCGPLRVRSTSVGAASARNIAAKVENAVRTNQKISTEHGTGTNSTTRTTLNAQRTVSNSGVTKKSPYVGPETRARTKMKQNNQNREVMKISSTVSTPKRSIFMKSMHVRPLPQLSPSISKIAVRNTTSNNKSIGDGHMSRPRTRVAHEPIRVRNTHEGIKGTGGLPPIESESRFRQSLTRRPKGGDSLDRDVTKVTEKENGDEIWTVVAEKPEPVLEFAPCLRSRVAAKKMQSISTTHSIKPPKTGRPRIDGGDALPIPRRRTEAEREAFFRRLSTPKTISAIKKCTK